MTLTDTPPETFRPRRKVRTVADWRALVYRAKGISNGTRVLLLYLGERMDARTRTVSVPRSELAEVLGVPPARITERIREAREAGFLDTVVSGRPGVTSVYAAMYPTPKGTDGCTPESRPASRNRGTKKRTPTPWDRGTDGGSPNSEHGETSVDVRESPSGDVKPCTATTASGRSDGESVNHAPGPDTPTRQRRSGETPKGQLLDEIQRCAADDGRVSLVLAELLDAAEPGLGEWAAWQWTLPPAAADRYEAGKQLLMMTNTYRVPVSA